MSEDELEQLLRMEGSTIHQVDYRQTESGALEQVVSGGPIGRRPGSKRAFASAGF